MPPRKPAGRSRTAPKPLAKLSNRLETLEIEWAPPSGLKPNPWNPNRQDEHEFEMLCKSITDAGFTQPIMVTEVSVEHDEEWRKEIESGRFAYGDLVIVDGEHRWRAAQHLGIMPIPYVRMPYGAMQARLSTLQMNRARGSEDIELATDVLRDLESLGVLDWAAESLDLGDTELQNLLDNTPAPEALAGEEFNEAWHPGGVRTTDGTYDNGRAQASHTPAALAEDQAYQRRVLNAQNEEERQNLRETRRTYTLMLRFADDEADAVRSALGEEPAETLLRWSREEVGA